MYLLIFTVFAALTTSFLCSVLEAALLTVNIARLMEQKRQGSKGAGLLLNLKQHHIDDAISAILTLNTIANTIGAALAGAQVAIIWGDNWVAYFSLLLTFLIFVFSEIIPKTIGSVYATQLSGAVGRILFVLTWGMTPILLLTRLITKLIARNKRAEITRGEIGALLSLATKQGAISIEESRVFSNLLNYDRLQVTDVMTPRPVLALMPAKATLAELLRDDNVQSFSRIPLYGEEGVDEIKGYVVSRQLLSYLAKGGDRGRPLHDFIRPITVLPQTFSVGAALRLLTQKREHLAMVLDEYGGVKGLVTLEDLIETILGVEIIDESDRVVDLRTIAAKIREERLRRIGQRLEEIVPKPAEPSNSTAQPLGNT